MSDPHAAFTSILVPYDGSEPAKTALSLALALTRPGTTLTVLNVVDETTIMQESATTVMAYDPTPLFEELDAQAQVVLAEATARCSAAGVTPVTDIVHDRPVSGILAAVKTHASDLCVMGTHARAGIARVFLGSTTEGILQLTDIPVLATRANDVVGEHPFATVLVALDDSDASRAGAELAARLAAAEGSHLIACHVADTTRLYDNAAQYGFSPGPLEREAERRSASVVSKGLAQADIALESVAVALVEGHPARAIVDAAIDQHATAIVMGTHGRRNLSRMFHGSVAESVVRESDVPVLVVRQPE